MRFHPCLAAVAAMGGLPALAGAVATPTLYGLTNGFGTPENNRLLTLDPFTAEITGETVVTLGGFEVLSSRAMARRASDGVFFGAMEVDGGAGSFDALVTIDPATGGATLVGGLGVRIAGLAFVGDRLVGVTGNNAAHPESLYDIDATTGAATFRIELGNGDNGEALSATGDGRLFHASGVSPGEEHFERLSLAPLAGLTDILTSHTYAFDAEILALAWSDVHGAMYMTNRDNTLCTIDLATGAQTEVGFPSLSLKGLAFDGATLYAVENARAGGFSNRLWTIDPLTGDTIDTIDVTANGYDLLGITGLARHPQSGALYTILDDDDDSRDLATIDSQTGVASVIGALGDRFAGLAFRADGTLLGVTGDGGATPETLYEIDIADASVTLLSRLGNGDDGEAIAVAEDGFLYHSSGIEPGRQFFERVDVDLFGAEPFLTDIGDGSHTFEYDEATALGWSDALDAMFVVDHARTLYTIDVVTGATAVVGMFAPLDGVAHIIRGLAFVDPPAAPCPGDTNGDGVVNFVDLNAVLTAFGTAKGEPGYLAGADVNGDHAVDFQDLNIVLTFFGVVC